MSSSIINLGLLGLFAAIVLIGVFLGFWRGAKKSVLRIITVVVAFAASYFVCLRCAPEVEALFYGKNMLEVIEPYMATVTGADTILPIIEHFDAVVFQNILMLPMSVIVVPVVFVVLFIAISLLLFLILWLVCLIFRIGKRKSFTSRLIGVGIGLVQSILVAIVIFTPIVGILDTAAMAAEKNATAEESAPADENGAAGIDAILAEVAECAKGPVTSMLGPLGSRAIFNSFVNITIGGEDINMSAAMAEISGVGLRLLELNYFNPVEISDEHKVALRALVDEVGDGEYTKNIIAGLVRGLARACGDGDIAITADEPYNSLFAAAIGVFEDSSGDDIAVDMKTVVEIYILMSDEQFFHAVAESDTAMRECLISRDENGAMLIDRILALIEENPRMESLVSPIAKMSISIMADNITFTHDTEAIYRDVHSGLRDAFAIEKSDYATEDEYLDAVAASIESTLNESEIELSEDIYRSMAEYINDNYEGTTELSDTDIDDLLIHYYAAYSAEQ